MVCCPPLIRIFLRCVLCGGGLGVVSSLMVNCSLVEVSCSPFFAVAFGVLFLASAGMMLAQLHSQPMAQNRPLLLFFAALNFMAGLVCFLLERDWSHGLNAQRKIPLYALLGSCLAFSVNFSSLDLMARFECFAATKLLVRAEWQLRVVRASCSHLQLPRLPPKRMLCRSRVHTCGTGRADVGVDGRHVRLHLWSARY